MGRSHRYRAALLSANKAGAYTAMPIFAYFVVAGSVMIALLFFYGRTAGKRHAASDGHQRRAESANALAS